MVAANNDEDRKGKGRGRKGGERGETESGKPTGAVRDRGLERSEDP